ncbi:hypothetical protein QO200_03075 [Flavobacterium sp. Arc3]|jgi:hypothetical protein
MMPKITKSQRDRMQNIVIQFFKYFYLNLRILKIVAGGHGSTRE